jgi:hypothetical protein
MLCTKSKTTAFERALLEIQLTPFNKRILLERYNGLLLDMSRQTFRISIFFHSARCVITVGSLIVPALLSIQYTNGVNQNMAIYWTTWVLSLLVTVCNGLITLLKVDKHYYHLHTVREHLISDGWQFLGLTGKYSGFHTPTQTATHQNQFIFFCHSIEKIRMQQVQEEYYKVPDTNTQNSQRTAQAPASDIPPQNSIAKNPLIPPTPLQGDLSKIPEAIKIALEQLSQTQVDGEGTEDKKDKKDGEAESMPV